MKSIFSRREMMAAATAAIAPFAGRAQAQSGCLFTPPAPKETGVTGPLCRSSWTFAENKCIRRRSFQEWHPREWTRLKAAYYELACRKPSDPTSLLRQAALHAFYCDGSMNDIHDHWHFLPWHRAFLYFHELILRNTKALSHSFRLPVWDWENHDSDPGMLSVPNEMLGLPIYDIGGCDITRAPTKILAPITLDSARTWLSSTDTSFVGVAEPMTAPRSAGDAHWKVHKRAGTVMPNLQLAAADPIFYAHHSNVDRMWWHWTRSYPQFAKELSDQDSWRKHCFTFYDPKGKPVTVSVDQLLDIEAMGYSFERPKFSLDRVIAAPLTDLLDAGVSYKVLLEAFDSWLPDSGTLDLQRMLSGLPNLTERASAFASELVQRMGAARVEIPVHLTIPAGQLSPEEKGRVFGVALRALPSGTLVSIGSFALPEHTHGKGFFAGAQLGPDAVKLVLSTPPGGLDLVTGPLSPAGGGALIRTVSLRNVRWEILIRQSS